MVLSRGRRVQRAFRREDAVQDVLAFAFGSDTREDDGGAAFDLVTESARAHSYYLVSRYISFNI